MEGVYWVGTLRVGIKQTYLNENNEPVSFVPRLEHPQAPPTDPESGARKKEAYPNELTPRREAWARLMLALELGELFHNPLYGLLRRNPYCVSFSRKERNVIGTARKVLLDLYPELTPEFAAQGDYLGEGLAYLDWFLYWMDWSLHRQGEPALYHF